MSDIPSRPMSEEPERVPAEVWPLAAHLAEEMEARGWQTQDVAIRMGGRTPMDMAKDLLVLDLLMCVHSDKLLTSDKEFDKLALAFDVSADFFRNLDAMWRKWPDRRVKFKPPEHIFGPVSRRSVIRVVEPTDTKGET